MRRWRRRRRERIDPFGVGEPWRHHVRAALQAEARYDQAVSGLRDGPFRERLEEVGRRVEEATQECWRIAQRGDALDNAVSGLDLAGLRERLAARTGSPAAMAGDDDDPGLATAAGDDPAAAIAGDDPAAATAAGDDPAAAMAGDDDDPGLATAAGDDPAAAIAGDDPAAMTAGGEGDPVLASLQAQLAVGARLAAAATSARERLALLEVRLDEAVASAVALSALADAGSLTGAGALGSDVDLVVEDLAALRAALEESERLDR